jgi:hypothetical protein
VTRTNTIEPSITAATVVEDARWKRSSIPNRRDANHATKISAQRAAPDHFSTAARRRVRGRERAGAGGIAAMVPAAAAIPARPLLVR